MASHYLRVVIPFGFAAVSAIGIGSAAHNSERAIISSFGQNFKSKLEEKIAEADLTPEVSEAEEYRGSENFSQDVQIPQDSEGSTTIEGIGSSQDSQIQQNLEIDDSDLE